MSQSFGPYFPFIPPFDTLQEIDEAIQVGRGAAAAVIGQNYDVYRLSDSTNGSILSGSPVYTNFPARIRRISTKTAIEDAIFDLVLFQATCDNRALLVGDTFQETGYEAQEAGVYVMVQARPTRETLWMRCESNCALSRPMPTAGQAAQLPSSGAVAVLGYGGYQKDTEQMLTLVDGLYAYSSVPGLSPASVQVGIQQLNRIRDSKDPPFPVTAYREHFLLYIPPTPGEELNEMDRINAANGDRYQIASILQTADAGLAGWITICERLGV